MRVTMRLIGTIIGAIAIVVLIWEPGIWRNGFYMFTIFFVALPIGAVIGYNVGRLLDFILGLFSKPKDAPTTSSSYSDSYNRKRDDKMVRGIYNGLDAGSRKTLRDLGIKY